MTASSTASVGSRSYHSSHSHRPGMRRGDRSPPRYGTLRDHSSHQRPPTSRGRMAERGRTHSSSIRNVSPSSYGPVDDSVAGFSITEQPPSVTGSMNDERFQDEHQQLKDHDDASLSSQGSLDSGEFVEDVEGTLPTKSVKTDDDDGMDHLPQWLRTSTKLAKSARGVAVLMVLCCIVLGAVNFSVATQAQNQALERQFRDGAQEVQTVAAARVAQFANALHSLALGMTSSASTNVALNTNSWPFQTMDVFHVYCNDIFINNNNHSLQVAFSPLVTNVNRDHWEVYALAKQDLVVNRTQAMMRESATGEQAVWNQYQQSATTTTTKTTTTMPISISPYIYHYMWTEPTNDQPPQEIPMEEPTNHPGPYFPLWQFHPMPTTQETMQLVNMNMLSRTNTGLPSLMAAAATHAQAAMSLLQNTQELYVVDLDTATNNDNGGGAGKRPQALVVQPVYAHLPSSSSSNTKPNATDLVGQLTGTVPFETYLQNVLDPTRDELTDMTAVVQDSCRLVGPATARTPLTFTYRVSGKDGVTFQGAGDLHDDDVDVDLLPESTVVSAYTSVEGDMCSIRLTMYPTRAMKQSFESDIPGLLLMLAIVIFLVLLAVFCTHDRAAEMRTEQIRSKAQRSNAIIAGLFPEKIREQLFELDGEVKEEGFRLLNNNAAQALDIASIGHKKAKFGEDESMAETEAGSQIADLFPSATVLFADMAGFTSWSSSRQPQQVFTLLETVFRAFDGIAKHRGVFKVETIGDCYVAVCGLPKPNEEHALAMARFARDILHKFSEVTTMLEVTLGPDTGELGLRVGLHSGPVTAGVVRGERARFQLFGDTVNTASRIETTGERGRIHCSQEMADLLREYKPKWIKKRSHLVEAKGKGKMQTYWVLPKAAVSSSVGSRSALSNDTEEETWSDESPETLKTADPTFRKEKLERLVFWNSEALLTALRHVVARREASLSGEPSRSDLHQIWRLEDDFLKASHCIDEVKEIVELPHFDEASHKLEDDPKDIRLGQKVEEQLREYVSVLQSLYLDNPFHNFEHASHVTMSIMKLLSRIVNPNLEGGDAADLHDYTFGITSDPLTQFTVLLAALIHDVDHRGVSNGQLCKENKVLASAYEEKSVAEQNSLDLAWDALMDPSFQDLRNCIYTTPAELKRFRQLLVQTVLATDIFDKELSTLRKKRWAKAFQIEPDYETQTDVNRKATVVIEHLIQASDVSHTMQHWQEYLKWNERLFHEMYKAFKEGRMEKDPSEGWYKGEIGFFDFYVIPLAKKLKDCGVFGVSSDEYLNYAKVNRMEWEAKGEEVVRGMVDKYTLLLKDVKPPTE